MKKLASQLQQKLKVSSTASEQVGSTKDSNDPRNHFQVLQSKQPPKYELLGENIKNQKALATNQWFVNLYLGEGNTICPYPYHLRAFNDRLEISYFQKVAQENCVIHPFIPKLSVNFGPSMTYQVTHYDNMSVTIKWTNNMGHSVVCPIVRGCPYLSFLCSSMDIRVRVLDNIELSQFLCQEKDRIYSLQNNDGNLWNLYLKQKVEQVQKEGSSILLKSNTNKHRGDNKEENVLRVSLVPANVQGQQRGRLQKLLSQNCDKIVTHTEIRFSYPTDATCTLAYKFNYQSMGRQESGQVILFSLPNHQKTFSPSKHQNALQSPDQQTIPQKSVQQSISSSNQGQRYYECIRGGMQAVLGDTWHMDIPLPQSSFKFSKKPSLDQQQLQQMIDALDRDLAQLQTRGWDPYFYGISMHVFARLALLAEELGARSQLDMAVEKAKSAIEPWLDQKNQDKFVYNSTWGGICCIKGLQDPFNNVDMGGGYFNDHHYQYGYFVYVASVIGRYDRTWLQKYKSKVDFLIRDYANPVDDDPYFPFTRHKDWFTFYSYASGHSSFGDGRNQESSSEAIHAYYSLYLWGQVTNNKDLENFGKLLAGMEIRSVKDYWHIYNDDVYPKVFSQRNPSIGILWDYKVDYSTWFGVKNIFMFGIQTCPFTPISHEYLTKEYIQIALPKLKHRIQQDNDSIPDDWLQFYIMIQAILEPEQAWGDTRGVKQWHEQACLSNTLYWIQSCM